MCAAINPADLSPEQKALLASPYGFGKHFLGLPISDASERKKIGECRDGDALFYEIFENDGQKRVVDDLDPHGAKVAAATCNGAGKTTIIIPTATFWFMSLFPRSKVVITSGVDRQVREQIFPSLHAHQKRLGGWNFHDKSIDAPNGSKCVGFTTKDGGHFEGWHGNKEELYDLLQHDGPLMIIVDEAKSVQLPIYDAIERCTYQRLLKVSSCGAAMGRFYDAFNKDGKYFRKHRLPASECPHADHNKNRELIVRRGLNDPLVRSKVFAEFMGSESDAVINIAWLARCTEQTVAFQDGPANYYCDFAAGGDENVFAEKRGNRIRIVAAWRERDTMRAIGEFIRLFRSVGLTPERAAEAVMGDNGGLGHVVIDRMHEVGWRIQRDDGGSAADDKDNYLNRSAECWFEAAKQLERGSVIIPEDDVLRGQMVSRNSKPRSDGRLQLESKEEMAKRGVGSPDRADAVFGVMRKPRSFEPVKFMGGGYDGRDTGFLEQMTQETGVQGTLAGASCE